MGYWISLGIIHCTCIEYTWITIVLEHKQSVPIFIKLFLYFVFNNCDFYVIFVSWTSKWLQRTVYMPVKHFLWQFMNIYIWVSKIFCLNYYECWTKLVILYNIKVVEQWILSLLIKFSLILNKLTTCTLYWIHVLNISNMLFDYYCWAVRNLFVGRDLKVKDVKMLTFCHLVYWLALWRKWWEIKIDNQIVI